MKYAAGRHIPLPKTRPGASLAIAAAVLFGASTPLAKLLLGEGLSPQLLAGLFYLGSGVGLSVLLLLRRLLGLRAGEAGLSRSDLPPLSVAVLLGGAVAPVLLMAGLARTTAASTSLLLNLEGLVTMAIAWLVLRENVDRRLLFGAFAILAGAVLLSWSGGSVRPDTGALLVAGACVAWGVDNNVTRSLARVDPMQIAAVKGLVAGTANFGLALLMHAGVPAAPAVAAAAVTGFLSYGVSLVLFVLGLRNLGTARTAAYFSTAPFIGAVLAVALFAEPVTGRLLAAGALMGIGLYLHLREQHAHTHSHEAMEHEHRHVHDEHHQHPHTAADPPGEPHSHRHRHEPLTHSHSHFPDLHHRHGH
jgi:drug/metabolite transporter (DMT)-like permease